MNISIFLKKNPTALAALLFVFLLIFFLSYIFSMPPDIKRILYG
jgi:hypothetical protein